MKFILGEKINMTQVFDEAGNVHPVTVVKAGPAVVTQVKTKEKDGYQALQISSGMKNAKNITKAQKGHNKELGNFRYAKEFRTEEVLEVGSKIELSNFKEGELVTVSAISKGKGFQGGVKRHGFSGGRRSHGNKHSEREPGSIGGGLRTRVPKGMRMAGRMGSDRITVKSLKIIKIDSVNNQIMIEGAIPGRRGTLVEIKG